MAIDHTDDNGNWDVEDEDDDDYDDYEYNDGLVSWLWCHQTFKYNTYVWMYVCMIVSICMPYFSYSHF